MRKFIPYDKLGKKAKREQDEGKRQAWGINPVSRKSENKKVYDRKNSRYRTEDDDTGSVLFWSPAL